MKKTNRILSVLMAILLTLGIAPTAVHAQSALFELTRDMVRWDKLHFVYDGEGHCPEVTVFGIDDVVLTENEDYTMECGSLVDDGNTTEFVPLAEYPSEVGVYICRIYGCGTYCNGMDIETEFEIEENPLGTPVRNNGILNYVADNGTTSAEITKKNTDENGVVWLKEESNGTGTWYGIDNSTGEFPEGSVFWVRWLSKEEDAQAFEEYYRQLDDEYKKNIKDDHLRIFETGVTDPDGNEYSKLDQPVDLYCEFVDNIADVNGIGAVFISEQSDEVVETKSAPAFYRPLDDSDEIKLSDLMFSDLVLSHFSPYAIYEKADGDTCELCGKVHGSSFFGRAIAFLHNLLLKLVRLAPKVFGWMIRTH